MTATRLMRLTIAMILAVATLAIAWPTRAEHFDYVYDRLCGMGAYIYCRNAASVDCGTLTAVTDFGTNPGKLDMCTYVPAGLAAGRPLVVVLHGCGQRAEDYGHGAGWTKLADEYRFAILLPQQTRPNNPNWCFNWFQPKDVRRHDAGGSVGEVASIWAMVQKMRADYRTDPEALYATGLSAGGAMAVALLAAYPEFRGGGIVAGLPFGCAQDLLGAFTCMNPGRDKSPQAWGELVRAAASGHFAGRGKRKISIWQGAADSTVVPQNADELVEQWTNVFGIDQTPDKTTKVASSDYQGYADADGTLLVEKYLALDTAHGVEIDPVHGCGIKGPYSLDTGICSSRLIAEFWGLSTH